MSRRGAMRPILELDQKIKAHPSKKQQLIEAFLRTQDIPLLDADTAVFIYADGPPDDPPDGVFLRHWVFGLESRQELLRLGDTHLFYLPVELPGSARVEYKLEVVRGENHHWMRDPHNPKLALDPFGANSVAAMPGYVEPEWAQENEHSRKGTIARFEIKSKVWGDTRPIEVYVPAEYKPHKRYPLVICHDGNDYQRFANIKTVLDNLIHRNEIAPVLVAFTSGVNRNPEYGAHPKQPDFLVKEVLPQVRKRFGVSEDVEDIGIMGASFGGVSSLWTAYNHPGTFGKLLLQSGSFVFTDIGNHDRGELWDPVVDFVNEYRRDPGRIDAKVYLSCGTFESLIWFNRGLGPLMRKSGLDVRFVEAQDGHNWIAWRDRLREGLSWLFPGRLWMTYE